MSTRFATATVPLAAAALAGAMLMADTVPARAQGAFIGGARIGAPPARERADFVRDENSRCDRNQGNGDGIRVSRAICR